MGAPLPSPGVALRIEHPSLGPSEISEQLGLTPTHAIASTGRPGRWRSRNYWLMRTRAASDESIGDGISSLLDVLDPVGEFFEHLHLAGGTASISVTWSCGRPSAFELDPALVGRLGKLRLGLMLEVFSGGLSPGNPDDE